MTAVPPPDTGDRVWAWTFLASWRVVLGLATLTVAVIGVLQ